MSKFAFFRQSGWLVVATTLSGFFTAALHKAAKDMSDYGVFYALFLALSWMTIPVAALQLTFAQQTASGEEPAHDAELRGALRAMLRGSALFCAGVAGTIFLLREAIVTTFKITNPAALWLTVAVGLLSMWQPLFMGVLQGRQNFLWFGWASIVNGIVRLIAVFLIVRLGGQAAGAMVGVLIGTLVSTVAAAWPSRDLMRGAATPFAWLKWVKRVTPITLSLGAITVLFTLDMIVVQAFYPAVETRYYAAAGLVGRTLYYFSVPMTYVLFPRVVRSAARAEKTTVLAQAVGATALLGGAAALGCTLLPEVPLRIIFDASFLKVAPLVQLYAWCLLWLPLSTVLINNLLARERYAVVPWAVLVAAGYAATLFYRHQSFEQVIHTLGLFNLLLFLGCAACTWCSARETAASVTGTAAQQAPETPSQK
jgi:O-antigen/teichoic acid export membrane protein